LESVARLKGTGITFKISVVSRSVGVVRSKERLKPLLFPVRTINGLRDSLLRLSRIFFQIPEKKSGLRLGWEPSLRRQGGTDCSPEVFQESAGGTSGCPEEFFEKEGGLLWEEQTKEAYWESERRFSSQDGVIVR